jgi:hypothetical protein
MAWSYLTRENREAVISDYSSINEHYARCNSAQKWFVANKVSAWMLDPKRHEHNREQGSFYITRKERKPAFDSAADFKKATQGIIECTNDYYNPKGTAKAYNSTKAARQIVANRMIQNADTIRPMEGRKGKAIVSRDCNDNKKVCKGNIQLMQSVNRSKVKELLNQVAGEKRTENNDRIMFACLGVLNNSRFKSCNDDMPNRYREATGGRIVGVQLNLQNIKREVKNAALQGQHDHDIVNCHGNFTAQLGKRHGEQTDTIDWFNDLKSNKDKDNGEYSRFVEQFTDNEKAFKTAMLALIYGAPLSDRAGHAINSLLYDGATDFINDENIKEFVREASNVRAVVLSKAERRKGQLFNHLGKPLEISDNRVTSKTKYAHILHGFEAAMLHNAIRLYGDNISLLSHDGFATKRPIETDSLEQEFQYQTGLTIKMKTTEIYTKSKTI